MPPYKEVVRGGYHYLAYSNGGFVREAPRTGNVLPSKHEFHPITPEVEVWTHVGAQARPAGVAGQVQTGGGIGRPQTTTPARPSPWTNYHATPPVVTGVLNNNSEVRSGVSGTVGSGSQGRSYPQTVLEGYGGYYINGASRPIEDVQIDGKCNFTYKERYIYKPDKQNVIYESVAMPLGALTDISLDQGYPDEVVLRFSTGKDRQSLGMSVAKAQPCFHCRRPAWTTRLRPSFALFLAPLFRAFWYSASERRPDDDDSQIPNDCARNTRWSGPHCADVSTNERRCNVHCVGG